MDNNVDGVRNQSPRPAFRVVLKGGLHGEPLAGHTARVFCDGVELPSVVSVRAEVDARDVVRLIVEYLPSSVEIVTEKE